MARKPTLRQRFEALVDVHEPAIAAAFRAAIQDIQDSAQIGVMVARLEAGDVDGAFRAIGMDPAAFRPLDRAILAAYEAGGAATVGTMPRFIAPDAGQVIVRFDVRNPRAEAWLADHSSTMVTRIIEDQRVAVRAALREGMEAGTNPRRVALDIVGRVNRATGKREGGVLGLTSPQERYAASARRELLSGDPEQMQNYLNRGRRDRRFDRSVLKAIKEGRAVDPAIAEKAVTRYEAALLNLRGEIIGRTEALGSLHESQAEAWRQAVESGAVDPQNVVKVWIATKDGRTRDTHAAMDRQTVGLNERFSNGLMYPCEPGGPPSEVIACRCTMVTRIDFSAGLT